MGFNIYVGRLSVDCAIGVFYVKVKINVAQKRR